MGWVGLEWMVGTGGDQPFGNGMDWIGMDGIEWMGRNGMDGKGLCCVGVEWIESGFLSI
jgi:hypothetical protein